MSYSNITVYRISLLEEYLDMYIDVSQKKLAARCPGSQL
jgi:hypothetical protein